MAFWKKQPKHCVGMLILQDSLSRDWPTLLAPFGDVQVVPLEGVEQTERGKLAVLSPIFVELHSGAGSVFFLSDWVSGRERHFLQIQVEPPFGENVRLAKQIEAFFIEQGCEVIRALP